MSETNEAKESPQNDATPTKRFECQYCYATPATKSQLIVHLKMAHHVSSANPASVRRQIQREVARGIKRGDVVRDPPPVPRGITPHQPLRKKMKLDPGELELLRKWLLFQVQDRYARLLDASPAVVIDGIALLCTRNFAPPPRETLTVDLRDLTSQVVIKKKDNHENQPRRNP